MTDTHTTAAAVSQDKVLEAVKQVVIRESRLSMEPTELADSEPLNGQLLRITSLGLLGMLIRLEDELDMELPDDIFTGQEISTVSDLADVVRSAGTGGELS
jgi:acyl carrier protein